MEKNKSEGASRGSAKNKPQGGRGGASSGKLRGLPTDSPQVRTSKTVSWILRHGADKEGVTLRPDGYARVQDLLSRPKLKDVTFDDLQELVKNDVKTRFQLLQEPDPSTGSSEPIWWIRANQGHSLKTVKVELQPVASVSDIPTGVAVHGTNAKAWDLIKTQGLSKMTRNHIHLAQGVPGSGVISGMRNSATILIYVDVQKALDAGIKFYLSANGVVLTEGDASGFLKPEFFQRVTNKNGEELTGWRKEVVQSDPPPKDAKLVQAGETTLAADSTTSLEKETEKLQL